MAARDTNMILKEVPKRRQHQRLHPYLSGNFAPIHKTLPLTPCSSSGTLPEELAGGEYVRNGGNPVTNEALGRDAHWFDGDGMLSGVSFRRSEKGDIEPEFVNQYILTDVYLASKTNASLRTPILPSIATLVNPLTSLLTIILRILRTILLVILTHLPCSEQAITKISVANTAVLFHDGRALATCESGPPMRVALPSLDTIGWFNGHYSEGEGFKDKLSGFGGSGLTSFMREWTTAHPRVDPNNQDLLLYHSTFIPPYINYSIVRSLSKDVASQETGATRRASLLNQPVPGIASPKLMHDFGVSRRHTIILDLPLSLDPVNLAKNKPVVAYDPSSRARFGVFPRYKPEEIRWFETNSCCIFHTANSWDSHANDIDTVPLNTTIVNMLACRLTSASLVFSAGDLAAPIPTQKAPPDQHEEEQCRLYYYQFTLPQKYKKSDENHIVHQWALSAIPFEFPSLRDSHSMSPAKYIYGCSVSDQSFGSALGRAVKINSLVKVDVETLIECGKRNPPQQIKGCVDTRSLSEIIRSKDPHDPIQVFEMPQGWYAQESRFVPRGNGISEDDGWILSYVFDESQLGEDGECLLDAKSELWIIDAKDLQTVIAKVHLPQRVPYGLHGNWFPEEQVLGQRSYERVREMPRKAGQKRREQSQGGSFGWLLEGEWRFG
ncbi:uncharacterized protein KY384_001000 [Bacidia gigantensis]|uniref:uncharacterized protein n=1 Tax=Bacidia gigantensis TaxID=2732470 RepID=UPI001D0464AF|nr:uncharacterized protein KY384_001000 [Bacidia gigantensis]KAG8534156.1 hypothetical protein KY384_001000 [Bacidia gigantensis]